MAAAGYLEIRGISAAIHDDVVEGSRVTANGGQDSANAFDRAQVGIPERITSLNRGIAGIFLLKRPEQPGGVNHANWLRVHEISAEAERLPGSRVVHNQVLNIENQRQLTGRGGIDDQFRMIANEMVDIELGFASFAAHPGHLPAVIFRRDVDGKAAQSDGVDVHRRAKQVPYTRAEAEIGDAEERLYSRLALVGISFTVNPQVIAGNLYPMPYGDMERSQVDSALEAVRERLDHALAEDGASIENRNQKSYRKAYQDGKRSNREPHESVSVAGQGSRALRKSWHTA